MPESWFSGVLSDNIVQRLGVKRAGPSRTTTLSRRRGRDRVRENKNPESGKDRIPFKRLRSQPSQWVVNRINPILRGWVNYYRIGHAGRCFNYVRWWDVTSSPCSQVSLLRNCRHSLRGCAPISTPALRSLACFAAFAVICTSLFRMVLIRKTFVNAKPAHRRLKPSVSTPMLGCRP